MADSKARWIDGGTVTSPAEFEAAGAYAGIKTYGPEPRRDVGLLVSRRDCTAAGIFTQNRVVGAPVLVSRGRLGGASMRAIVANSGNSNVATGARGLEDAERMAALAAKVAGVEPSQTFVASTGVIGRHLPLPALERALGELRLSAAGGSDFARAIMTTDMVSKECALSFECDGITYTIGGVAKGAGMAHPNMATVLCFVTTDAPVERAYLQRTLKHVADETINMVDVDMDTSTSDMMLLLANGAAGGAPICEGHPAEKPFAAALLQLCTHLARELARDGEGARTLIVVDVRGAVDTHQARLAARTVASSPLVKTMVTGRDPNPGRVMMAIGRSGAEVDVERTSVYIGEHCAFRGGAPSDVDLSLISAQMDAPEVAIGVDLGLGNASARAWGCDLTEEYVRINADYTT